MRARRDQRPIAAGFFTAGDSSSGGGAAVTEAERDPGNPATWGKVGRNEPCPCGSGKKFKHCHGALV